VDAQRIPARARPPGTSRACPLGARPVLFFHVFSPPHVNTWALSRAVWSVLFMSFDCFSAEWFLFFLCWGSFFGQYVPRSPCGSPRPVFFPLPSPWFFPPPFSRVVFFGSFVFLASHSPPRFFTPPSSNFFLRSPAGCFMNPFFRYPLFPPISSFFPLSTP